MTFHRSVRFLAFGLLLLILPAALSTPSSAQIAVGVSVRLAPPALPVYEQPICPGPGHLWTPGYWAWSDDDGYYWVPGTWVVAPVGLLWTPGYWGWGDGVYAWHAGYWGPHIGFYGGVNYGFGYGGVGFVGGEWRHGAFFYNSAVMHVDSVHIKNVYVNRTVIVHNESHVAFNGGEGGIHARPSHEEEAAMHETHRAAIAEQTQHEHAASKNRDMFASANHGRPAVAATGRPGEFKGHNVVAAKSAGAPYKAPAISPKEARASSSASKQSVAPKSHAANTPASKSKSASTSTHNNTASSNYKPTSTHSEPHTTSAANTPSSKSKSTSTSTHNNTASSNYKPTSTHSESHTTSAAKSSPAPKPQPQKQAAPAPHTAPHESSKHSK